MTDYFVLKTIQTFENISQPVCGKMFCTTCGGRYKRVINNLDPVTIKEVKKILEVITLYELDNNFREWRAVLQYIDPKGYHSVFIREAEELSVTNAREVDIFLLRTKNMNTLDNPEFSKWYNTILNYAISKSVIEKDESLAETVIIVLKDKAKKYHGLIEYALTVSRHNMQMKRVLYNFFREEIEEVRDYQGDGNTSFTW